MRNPIRTTIWVTGLAATALLTAGTPATASPAADEYISVYKQGDGTNNVASDGFAKSRGGVNLGYSCNATSGDTSNTRAQIVSLNQTTAYRDFPAICDGDWHYHDNLNVSSNTAMRVRVHVYSAGRVNASVLANCYGRKL